MHSKVKILEKGLHWPNLREVAELESVKSRFKYSIHLFMIYFSHELARSCKPKAGSREKKIDKCMENLKRLPVKMAFKTVIRCILSESLPLPISIYQYAMKNQYDTCSTYWPFL